MYNKKLQKKKMERVVKKEEQKEEEEVDKESDQVQTEEPKPLFTKPLPNLVALTYLPYCVLCWAPLCPPRTAPA